MLRQLAECYPNAHFSLSVQLSTTSGLPVVSLFSSTGSPRGTGRSLGNAASISAQKQDKKGFPLSLRYKPRVSLQVISETSLMHVFNILESFECVTQACP